jgi:CheY-like chemotaxis protein
MLRASKGPNRGTAVIALTGSVEPADVDACLAAGLDAFVAKPVTPAELLQAVAEAMRCRPGSEPRLPAAGSASR